MRLLFVNNGDGGFAEYLGLLGGLRGLAVLGLAEPTDPVSEGDGVG